MLLQDLAADNSEDEGEAPSSLRNVNQDMQRALGALGTAEAAQAFRAGGWVREDHQRPNYQCLGGTSEHLDTNVRATLVHALQWVLVHPGVGK